MKFRSGRVTTGRASLLMLAMVFYGCWIGMLVTHELGHVLNAWLSGARVERVSIPLLGFSQTIVSPNPHELFVVWGGAVWGVVLPAGIVLIVKLLCERVRDLLKFFAGFCLIANGSYIGAGSIVRAGDARDMVRLGTPSWAMIVFGVTCVTAGLWLWHDVRWLTRRRAAEGATRPAREPLSR